MTGVWKTHDGREIPYEAMDTGHLMSVLAMLEKNVERMNERLQKGHAALNLEPLTPETTYSCYRGLLDELAKRAEANTKYAELGGDV